MNNQTYFISQVITVIYFAILNTSFLFQKRTKVLIANFIAHIGQAAAMYLLNGNTGAAMATIMIIRDLTFLILEKLNKKSEKKDLIIFVVTILLIIALTTITYTGPLSLLSVSATLVLTYALWQKDVTKYKFLSIIAGVLWLAYNIFIKSIMGVLLEITVILFATIGYLKEKKQVNIYKL